MTYPIPSFVNSGMRLLLAALCISAASMPGSAAQDAAATAPTSGWAIDVSNHETCYTDFPKPADFPTGPNANDPALVALYAKSPDQFETRWVKQAFFHKREIPLSDIAKIENKGVGHDIVTKEPVQLMYATTVTGELLQTATNDLGVLWACRGSVDATVLLNCIYSTSIQAQCRLPNRGTQESRVIPFYSVSLMRRVPPAEWSGMLEDYARTAEINRQQAAQSAAYAQAAADAKARDNQDYRAQIASAPRGALLFCEAAYIGDERSLSFDRMELDCHLNGEQRDHQLPGGWLLEHGWSIESNNKEKIAHPTAATVLYDELTNVILRKGT